MYFKYIIKYNNKKKKKKSSWSYEKRKYYKISSKINKNVQKVMFLYLFS